MISFFFSAQNVWWKNEIYNSNNFIWNSQNENKIVEIY